MAWKVVGFQLTGRFGIRDLTVELQIVGPFSEETSTKSFESPLGIGRSLDACVLFYEIDT